MPATMNLLALAGLLIALSTPQQEWVLDDLRLLAISPESSRAVVWIPGQGDALVEVGEMLPGSKVTLAAVLAEKLVVEQVVEEDGRRILMRAWVERSGGKRGEVRVRWLRHESTRNRAEAQPISAADAIELALPREPTHRSPPPIPKGAS